MSQEFVAVSVIMAKCEQENVSGNTQCLQYVDSMWVQSKCDSSMELKSLKYIKLSGLPINVKKLAMSELHVSEECETSSYDSHECKKNSCVSHVIGAHMWAMNVLPPSSTARPIGWESRGDSGENSSQLATAAPRLSLKNGGKHSAPSRVSGLPPPGQ